MRSPDAWGCCQKENKTIMVNLLHLSDKAFIMSLEGGETVKERNLTLAALRVNKRMQQKKVAGILGVTPTTLANWERGKTVPNIMRAQQLADIYGTSLDDILFTLKSTLKD